MAEGNLEGRNVRVNILMLILDAYFWRAILLVDGVRGVVVVFIKPTAFSNQLFSCQSLLPTCKLGFGAILLSLPDLHSFAESGCFAVLLFECASNRVKVPH
jgi:hypothetical protein